MVTSIINQEATVVTYHRLYYFTALKLLIEAEKQLGFVTKEHLLGIIKEMERLVSLVDF
jgi:uncharacterized protein involved in response to NO